MPLSITKNCISCDICLNECPNNAISVGKKFHNIDQNLCTECVGFYKTPNCKSVCPISNAIVQSSSLIKKKI